MGLGSNFESVALSGDDLLISGISEPMEGGDLVSRHVAFHQHGHVEHRDVPDLGSAWKLALSAPAFLPEPVLAVGCEVYFTKEAGNANDGDQLPSFATVTWAQTFDLK
jgi:hypothetical protein